MRYFKRLVSTLNFELIKGRIYKEDEKFGNSLKIIDLFQTHPNNWQEVNKIEWALQECKERFKNDPVVRCADDQSDIYTIESSSIEISNNDVLGKIKNKPNHLLFMYIVLYDRDKDQFAEIVEDKKPSFHTGEFNSKCDEACHYHCTKAGTQKPDCIEETPDFRIDFEVPITITKSQLQAIANTSEAARKHIERNFEGVLHSYVEKKAINFLDQTDTMQFNTWELLSMFYCHMEEDKRATFKN